MSRFSSRFSPSSKPRAAPVPRPVAEVLGRTDAFAALRAGVEQTAALERALSELLPAYLATSIEPGFVRDGALTLFAAHSALAARLRHLEPRLIVHLAPLVALAAAAWVPALQRTPRLLIGAGVAVLLLWTVLPLWRGPELVATLSRGLESTPDGRP